jgi:CRP-like cAMP-binding protein
VSLVLAEVINPGGQPLPHVYFPLDGFISLVTLIDGKPVMETGMVGYEGMLGIPLALGIKKSPSHAVVQGTGKALRMSSSSFQQELRRSRTLQTIMHQYIYVVMTQFATSAACIGTHRLPARLARWLLMTQDRAQTDSFRVTHLFLSYMLGVRRVAITTAAKTLQRQGIITYCRGHLTVLDRQALESVACGCYETDLSTYVEVLN